MQALEFYLQIPEHHSYVLRARPPATIKNASAACWLSRTLINTASHYEGEVVLRVAVKKKKKKWGWGTGFSPLGVHLLHRFVLTLMWGTKLCAHCTAAANWFFFFSVFKIWSSFNQLLVYWMQPGWCTVRKQQKTKGKWRNLNKSWHLTSSNVNTLITFHVGHAVQMCAILKWMGPDKCYIRPLILHQPPVKSRVRLPNYQKPPSSGTSRPAGH